MARRLLLVLLAGLTFALAGAADAQLSERNRDYYQDWLKLAERAETVIEADRASSAALEQLRSDIDEYREVFNRARKQNSERIETLQAQIDALGPPPEEGETEAPDIAELRKNLNEQLTKLRVPRVVSEEAHSRANGLISEIDQIIRGRNTKEFLSRAPSPLNPVHWPTAFGDVSQAMTALWHETTTNMKSATTREQINERLPVLIGLVVVGLLLIAFGRRGSERMGDYLRQLGGNGSGVWTFAVSLTRILLPWMGVLALVVAALLSGIPGVRGSLILENVPYWAAIIFYFDWIWRQLYVMRLADGKGSLSPARLIEMRTYVGLLASMLVLHEFVQLFEKIEQISDATRSVIAFPVILVTGLLLLRLLQIRRRGLREAAEEGDDDDGALPGFGSAAELVRRILFILGALSPVLAAAGYVFAAEAIVYPSVKSLALIAALVIVHRFLTNLYGWITRKGDSARESLFSVMVGFVLAALALPLLALYWGAREADLTEMWSRLMAGFDIGGVTISPSNFMVFVVVFAVGYTLTRLLQGGLRASLLPKTRIDPGGQNAIVAGTGYVGIFLAAVIAITWAGFDLSSLAIVAGALSVGIGFGLQTIVSNFVSGIILLIERPISKGDWIDVNGQMGYVRDISVRSTRIETFDRSDVIIPNSDLISGSVTNYTRGNTVGRVIVPVGVAYGSDTRQVEKILDEIANDHPMVLANPAPSVVFQGFGADSLDFEIRAVLRDVNWVLSVKSDMNHDIAKRFAEAGLEIPFAQRDLWLRNPEVLRTGREDTAPVADEDNATASGDRQKSRPVGMTESDLDQGEGDEI
ncbi:DUF3772 domain-containing protein [Cribrihabitans marinus]|nr:DUF3772 domain-containing protein [Cribrihabitans marinus]GGH18661.1 mechanosensitive ion channel protein MscS [Cribrihabitans marinus]